MTLTCLCLSYILESLEKRRQLLQAGENISPLIQASVLKEMLESPRYFTCSEGCPIWSWSWGLLPHCWSVSHHISPGVKKGVGLYHHRGLRVKPLRPRLNLARDLFSHLRQGVSGSWSAWEGISKLFYVAPCVCGVAVWFLPYRNLNTPHFTSLHTQLFDGKWNIFTNLKKSSCLLFFKLSILECTVAYWSTSLVFIDDVRNSEGYRAMLSPLIQLGPEKTDYTEL